MVLMVCGGLVEIPAHAALLGVASGFNPPLGADSDQYDFASWGLDVNNSGLVSGVDTFTASSAVNIDTYTLPLSSSSTPFYGTFNLTAQLVQNSGLWYVQSSSFTITGNLEGGTSGDLLLSGSLLTGPEAHGANGAGVSGYDANTFEFIFSVTGGNPTILNDFLGKGALDNILISVPGWAQPFDGLSDGLGTSFNNDSFSNPVLDDNAFADTYVPESSSYGLAASVVGATGFIWVRRREHAVVQTAI